MILYIIFNTINNKMYVGITKDPINRWKRHKWVAKGKDLTRKNSIHHAIAKYGTQNFIFKPIEQLPDLDIANKREMAWIKFLKEENYQLYNETAGGDGHSGYKCSDEQKQAMSKRNSGSGNPMYGVQLFGEANGHFGKKMKPHVKQELLKCRRKLTDEQIIEIRSLFKTNNYTQTQLSKQFNISLSQINGIVHNRSWSDKPNNDVKKNLTEEQVKEIRNLYSSGEYYQKDLAKMFSVSRDHISEIIRFKKWKNII